MMNKVIRLISALIAIAVLGCTVKEAVEPLRPTSFISNPEKLQKPKNTPFDLAWVSPGASSVVYDKLVVEPVRVDKINPENWIYSAGPFILKREIYVKRINDLAGYLQNLISDRFEFYSNRDKDVVVEKIPAVEPLPSALPIPALASPTPQPPIEAVDSKDKTLIIQISIAEANFGDPLLYGSLLAVPVPGLANLSTTAKAPSLTLETRLIDKESGQVVAEIVDRRFPQVKIVDLSRLSISGALQPLAVSYATDLVESFYRKQEGKVRKRLPFSLFPW